MTSNTEEPTPQPTVEYAPKPPDSSAPTAGFDAGTSRGDDPNATQRIERVDRPAIVGHEILGELGRGGMGVVYRARQIKLNRVVALKMVLGGPHAGTEQLSRFYAEAQSVAHLQHSNIVQIYEVAEQGGLPYFSLEFVDGGSLAQKAAGKPQPVREAAQVTECLARAMHYAHQNGVVHRDLKPANVLLTTQGIPKITDFGLAKRLEGDSSSQTRSGTVLGTPSYMAPEQARGEVHRVGPLTDVYSLGAILYELLTGRPPFAGPTPMDTVVQVTRDEPVAPSQLQPKIPRDLETICMKCLEKEQSKRYSSADTLADDLHRFLAGEPIVARPVSSPERLWRWCRRNPVVTSLTAAVAAVLIVATAVSLYQRNVAVEARQRAEFNETLAKEKAIEADQARVQANARAESERKAHVLADQKTEEAVAAHKEADSNGILAVNTLYNVVSKVQDQLKDRSDMQKLRQDIVQNAMTGLKQVSGTAQTSLLAGRVRGVALQRTGDILLQLGQSEQALEVYQQSRSIYEDMLNSDPTSDVARYSLAALSEKVGDTTHQLEGIAAAAAPYYQQSMELREELAGQETLRQPVNATNVAQSLFNIYAKQWNVSVMLGDPQRAYEYFRKLEAIASTLRSGKPESYPTSFILGVSTLYFHLGEMDQSRTYCERALQQSVQAVATEPSSVAAQRDLANSYGTLGDLELQLRNPTKALELYGKAHEIQRELAAKDPENSDAQRDLSLALYRLGTAETALAMNTEADEHQRQALEIRRICTTADPRNAFKQVELFLSAARCGYHQDAVERAGALFERVRNDPGMLFYVACGYALSSSAVAHRRPPDQLTRAEQQIQAQYADAAITVLDAAIQQGYKDPIALIHDPDLEPIRDDPRFRSLIEQLQSSDRVPSDRE